MSQSTPANPARPAAPHRMPRRSFGAEDDLVQLAPAAGDRTIPCVITPAIDGLTLTAWAQARTARIDEWLRTHRALLFRGFHRTNEAEFTDFVSISSGGRLLEYRDRSTPRRLVAGRIYTSTEYPPEHRIALHNEGTYWRTWPLKAYFGCVTPAARGGETPIADCRRVLARLDRGVQQRFLAKRVCYVRNYNDGFGLKWQEAYQSSDRAEVEAYGRANAIEVEWKSGDRLRTRQVRDAIVTHPGTGEPIWFNHAAFFHVSSLDPAIGRSFLDAMAVDDLPYNTYYGDGSEIEPEIVAAIREAYEAETVRFPWQAGDVLMLDNVTVAHGREAYEGPRRILVGLAEPHSPADAIQE
jgi:alpha-ketoglutarate-dependent taurine dioxygenase